MGTPGRLVALLRSGNLSGAAVAAFVLDEADRLLHESMYDSVAEVYSHLPKCKQVRPLPPLPPIIPRRATLCCPAAALSLYRALIACRSLTAWLDAIHDPGPVRAAPMPGRHARHARSERFR